MAIIDLRDDPQRNAALLAQVGAGIGALGEALQSEESRFLEATREQFRENPQLFGRAVREAAARDDSEEALQSLADLMQIEDVGLLVRMAELTPQTFEEALDQARRMEGVAGQQAVTEVTVGEAQEEEALTTIELEEARRKENIPSLTAMAEAAQLQFGRELTDFEQKNLEDLQGIYETLDPEERRRLNAAVIAPNYLRDIQFREQMELEGLLTALRQRAGGATPMELAADALSLKSAYLEEFKTLEEQLREVEDPEQGEMEAFIHRYNNLADDWFQLFPDSPVTIIDPLEALFGKDVAGVARFRTMMPDDFRATMAAARIMAGHATEEELMEELELSIPDAAEREEMFNAILQRVEEARSRTQVPIEERWFEAAVGGTLNMFGEGLEAIRGGPGAVGATTIGDIERFRLPPGGQQ